MIVERFGRRGKSGKNSGSGGSALVLFICSLGSRMIAYPILFFFQRPCILPQVVSRASIGIESVGEKWDDEKLSDDKWAARPWAAAINCSNQSSGKTLLFSPGKSQIAELHSSQNYRALMGAGQTARNLTAKRRAKGIRAKIGRQEIRSRKSGNGPNWLVQMKWYLEGLGGVGKAAKNRAADIGLQWQLSLCSSPSLTCFKNDQYTLILSGT